MTKVYVVMSSDFPNCVFAKQIDAETFTRVKNDQNLKRQEQGFRPIYWKVYPFKVHNSLETMKP